MIYQDELDFARRLAHEAGETMKKYSRTDQQTEIKEDFTPVTIADKTINNDVIESVKVTFPDHGVNGEEASWEKDREKVWVCDPIDGTVAYITHVPTSVFSIALVIDGVPTVAVVYNPWTDELYHSVKGEGSYRNDEKINVSSRKWGERTQISTSSSRRGDVFEDLELVDSLNQQKVFIHGVPGIIYAGCSLAEGAIDARIFNHHSAHDIASLKLIIEEAGGKVTDIEGNEQRYDRPIKGAIMSNGLIHDDLLNLIQKVPDENNRN